MWRSAAARRPRSTRSFGELAPSGVTVYAEALNVTDAEAVPAFVDKAAEALGGCDIFISFTSANLGEDSDAGWDAVMQADILPMRRGVAAAKPYLLKSDAGSIICMSSTGAVEEFMGVQPYNALKAAVMVYSSDLSQALAPQGVRVNCITPGPIMTEDGPWTYIKNNMTPFYESTLAKIPIGRMATGEELARADRVRCLAGLPGDDRGEHRGRWRLYQTRAVLSGAPPFRLNSPWHQN